MTIAISNAAEGLPRRAFTVDHITLMLNAGILTEDDRVELIEGELVVMAAKHAPHEYIKHALNRAFSRAAPEDLFVAIETSLQLARDILVEPDITLIAQSVYDADPKSFAKPSPEDILLVVEVAASSLNYDRTVKARLYARFGIREFWVIDAEARVTWVHTGPTGDTWSSIVERGPNETLPTPALPGFAISLAAIG